jgi:hypothetical protein
MDILQISPVPVFPESLPHPASSYLFWLTCVRGTLRQHRRWLEAWPTDNAIAEAARRRFLQVLMACDEVLALPPSPAFTALCAEEEAALARRLS